jgi:hypothetical protein
MSCGLPNEAMSGCRLIESLTLMDLYFDTHLYLHSNNDMYMWNQVNCTQNYYANIGTSAPYNQWSYPMMSCPRHNVSGNNQDEDKVKFYSPLWVTAAQGSATPDAAGLGHCSTLGQRSSCWASWSSCSWAILQVYAGLNVRDT